MRLIFPHGLHHFKKRFHQMDFADFYYADRILKGYHNSDSGQQCTSPNHYLPKPS